ncbi:aldehyde dehydrogenase family protein [Nocardia albiluteola]|uniref:aldehyde dehydrogenase family protein n=1 Tax=Nocardia albiluteola TaxID=2842303 RepID=UPI0027DF575C|nr:aldehyde dehydrogenase family protein [Nocardia albiluteola]
MTAQSDRPEAIAIEPGRLFIGGQWRDSLSGATLPTVNPATEEVITTVASAGVEDVHAAVDAARRAFEESGWASMRGSERAKVLLRIADLIDANAHELAYRESVDMGMLYTDARYVAVAHIANMFRYFSGWTTKFDGAVRPAEPVPGQPGELLAYTRREPLGVIAAITPFNFPLVLSVSKIAPALAAGNCVIHKPASDTPLSALTLARIMQEAGVPDGVYNTICGPGAVVGDALVRSPGIDKVAFTGSTAVGRGLAQGAAETFKHVTLELGGKSPNIVFADADLDAAAQTAFFACMWNKGEVCVAGTRLLVQRDILDDMLDQLRKLCAATVLGDPLDPATTMGPLASRAEYNKVLDYIESGKQAGIPLVASEAKVPDRGFFVPPAIFGPGDNSTRIAREEIFGPVLTVIPFTDFDEAIRIANDTPYGLASGVQTTNARTAIRAAHRLQAGTVWVNTWHHYDPSAPFGGYKTSGYGRENGPESLDAYTQLKTIWMDLA